MPISKERFESLDDVDVQATAGYVVELLVANPDKAFTDAEVAELAGVKLDTVWDAVQFMKIYGAVRTKGLYIALDNNVANGRLEEMRADLPGEFLEDVDDEGAEDTDVSVKGGVGTQGP